METKNFPCEQTQVVDAGKRLEQVQTMKFEREIEREKSLKLSWKVCQQTRQINGIVDKMQRHRRGEEAQRETGIRRAESMSRSIIFESEILHKTWFE